MGCVIVMSGKSEVQAQPRRRIAVLFTATIFTSAFLLFLVQPLFTRMVLPHIGGAAAVWTTAMLFFQTVLILGYLYAHVLSRHFPVAVQIAIHIGLLVLALLFLPLSVPASWQYDATQPVVTQTLWLYALGVGLPFAVLSANAPLIQSWYRRSGGPSADDPYFLYAASNLGSLVALLAFPLIAEPLFGVTTISIGWSLGFVLLGPLLVLSGLAARRPPGPQRPVADHTGNLPPLKAKTLGYWAFLAFLPSSLMLCVTTKISTDLGSFPLIWVIPLALYLLTFVLAFWTGSPGTAAQLRKVLPFALAALIFFSFKPAGTLTGFALMLLAFFIVGLTAHRLLFEARPDPRHLTLYYLTMSIGGALGGIFNSIIAPIAFDRLTEYPVTVALCALLMLSSRAPNLPRALALGLVLSPVVILPMSNLVPILSGLSTDMRAGATLALLAAVFAAFYRLALVPVITTITVLGMWALLDRNQALLEDRSFFGMHVVSDRGDIREYSNGTTVHGAQLLDQVGQRPTPIYYYHPNGPIAQVIKQGQTAAPRSVGIVGLGIGALSCYRRPDEDWHFYEIDKKVVDIALDPTYFDFMAQCGQNAALHLGDARIVLQGQTGLTFDLLVIDAYSSDAIPVHLATLEAIRLYMDRLNPDGILVFHISNRFYDLSLPLSGVAKALGLEARIWDRRSVEGSDQPGADQTGAEKADVPSTVVALARTRQALGKLADDPRWVALPEPSIPVWTDDHADLLGALR